MIIGTLEKCHEVFASKMPKRDNVAHIEPKANDVLDVNTVQKHYNAVVVFEDARLHHSKPNMFKYVHLCRHYGHTVVFMYRGFNEILPWVRSIGDIFIFTDKRFHKLRVHATLLYEDGPHMSMADFEDAIDKHIHDDSCLAIIQLQHNSFVTGI